MAFQYFISSSHRWFHSGSTSQIKNDDDKFEVKFNCRPFKPEQITVKTVDNNVVVRGKHEKKDHDGYTKREFTRKYALPKDCEIEKVESYLSSKGVLRIEAPKKSSESTREKERIIPVTRDKSEKSTKNSSDKRKKK